MNALDNLDLLVIGGSPASGKTTVSKALSELWRKPFIDFGRIREFHLDRNWSNENPEEEEMSFDHLQYIVRSYVRHGRTPVIVSDMKDNRVTSVPRVFADLRFLIVTLTCADEFLKSRIVDPTRDSGFSNLPAALDWNGRCRTRDTVENEIRLDTSRLNIAQSIEAVGIAVGRSAVQT